ncbi:PLP-dependent aminotransferase family protein [Actinomycetes bacterium M1A6_2h]
MSSRVLGATTLARDLGQWRPGDGVKGRPTYRALADGVRLLVHDGRIPLGVALPSERDLAGVLKLSRTTVTNSYAVLRDEGYLVSRQGSRSTVSLPASARMQVMSTSRLPSAYPGPTIDMSHAAMGAPSEAMLASYASALQSLPTYLDGHGMEPVGLAALRSAIARRYDERGLPTSPDQIMVTSGAQHAWRLLLGVSSTRGDRVLVEHPTYPNALEALRRTGARPVPVPLRPGPDHWDLAAVRSAAQQTGARIAHTLPDFHNPTGAVLAAEGRAELVSIAREQSLMLVVDETMAELWLDEAPPPPVASFANESTTTVVTIGSASKSFWGGLRVGWIRAKPSLITRLASSRAALDIGTPIMDQLACAALLDDHEAVLGPRREELRRQRAALAGAVRAQLPEWDFETAPGGLSLWLQMPAELSTALAAIAPSHGVILAAGPRFGVEGAFERFLRLPYARVPEELTAAVTSVASAYRALAPSHAVF